MSEWKSADPVAVRRVLKAMRDVSWPLRRDVLPEWFAANGWVQTEEADVAGFVDTGAGIASDELVVRYSVEDERVVSELQFDLVQSPIENGVEAIPFVQELFARAVVIAVEELGEPTARRVDPVRPELRWRREGATVVLLRNDWLARLDVRSNDYQDLRDEIDALQGQSWL